MPAEWGQAKIEILALRDEILGKLEQGILVRTIYEELSASGRITMSRRSFYDRVKRLRAEASKPTRNTSAQSTGRTTKPIQNYLTEKSKPATSNLLPSLKAEEQEELDRLWEGSPEPSLSPSLT
ncbi:hypothetical protein [Thalassospira sp.]|uniref:hypothetical protein n=1 Tax=Thalassospira sp. TaxID=1912094 RepID=UPI001B05B9C5|nr:hypothetical protein [Thalassospira sp.]MBO6807956.1 hypothetical protein [Thalassospira sp.]MBO6842508.1 hypothetical protein [Thalassospira sp.]